MARHGEKHHLLICALCANAWVWDRQRLRQCVCLCVGGWVLVCVDREVSFFSSQVYVFPVTCTIFLGVIQQALRLKEKRNKTTHMIWGRQRHNSFLSFSSLTHPYTLPRPWSSSVPWKPKECLGSRVCLGVCVCAHVLFYTTVALNVLTRPGICQRCDHVGTFGWFDKTNWLNTNGKLLPTTNKIDG